MHRELRQLCNIHYGKSPRDVQHIDGTVPIYGTSGLVGWGNQALFEGNGVVIPRKGTLDNPTYVEGEYWVIDTAYVAIPFENVDAKWLFYSLCNFNLKQLNEATGVPSINRDYLYRTKVYANCSQEQQKIVKILTTVDNLIEQTEAAIDKYQAIKQGMMQDFFSRGIDVATRQLRPSRQEAPELYKETNLGWVPKDWQENSLEQMAEFVTSGSRGWAKFYDTEGAIFIRIGNLTKEHINFRFDDVIRVNLKDKSEGIRTKVGPGDLLISITADLGIIAVANEQIEEAYVNQHIALIRPKEDPNLGRFLGHFFASDLGQTQFRKYNDAGAKAGLNLPTIRNLSCFVPENQNEYQLIAKRIDTIDTYIIQLKRERDKYCCQKQGLMQDLLTGKVRVKLDDMEVKKE